MMDGEKGLRDALDTAFVSTRVATEEPGNLEEVLPVIVVRLAFGRDGAFWTKPVVTLDVDYFAATRQDARAGALAVGAWIHANIPGMATADGMFGNVATNVHPNRTPWSNPAVSRVTASYSIQLHSH